MPDRRYRVLAIAAHPVQYMAPILRRMAAHPALDLHVAYCSLRGAEAGHDPEFGASIQWDVPLLDGYSWSEVPNRGSGKESFFGLRNPGLWKLIRGGNFDAILCFTGYRQRHFLDCLFCGALVAQRISFRRGYHDSYSARWPCMEDPFLRKSAGPGCSGWPIKSSFHLPARATSCCLLASPWIVSR